MKKILIFGKNGQVGWELQKSCIDLGDVRVCGSHEIDFMAPEKIRQVIREYQPSHIINASAYTAVDKAESDIVSANQINGYSVGVIAEEARAIGAHFTHYSTDYVFNGTKVEPYLERDIPDPVNVYGRSKLLGEKLIQEVSDNYLILRVSWVYGSRGHNFLKTMLRLGMEREELKIVGDQHGSPTWCRDIAEVTAKMITTSGLKDKSGIYHVSPLGCVSWCEFASQIFLYASEFKPNCLKVKSVVPISTSEYPTPARRPMNSLMSSGKLLSEFGISLPEWSYSLRKVIAETMSSLN